MHAQREARAFISALRFAVQHLLQCAEHICDLGHSGSTASVERMVRMLEMLDRPKDLVDLIDQDHAAVSVVLAVAEVHDMCSHALCIAPLAEHLQETCTKVVQALAVAGARLVPTISTGPDVTSDAMPHDLARLLKH